MSALGWGAVLGAWLVAGVFFAFSALVMDGLGQLSPAEGVRAMQAINRAALRAPFLLVFFGSAAAWLLYGGLLLWRGEAHRAGTAAALLYLLGCVGVTALCNVPRNEALAGLAAGTPAADAAWVAYLSSWVGWNHVRMLACAAAGGLGLWSLWGRGV